MAAEINEDNVFLLPCPFCGSVPTIQGSVRKWVACLDCGAETKRADDWPSVIEWWNRRPDTKVENFNIVQQANHETARSCYTCGRCTECDYSYAECKGSMWVPRAAS